MELAVTVPSGLVFVRFGDQAAALPLNHSIPEALSRPLKLAARSSQ